MLFLPIVLRQGAAAAQRAAGKGKVADLLQHRTRDHHAFGLLNLRSFVRSCSCLDTDDGKPGASGTLDESEQDDSLPENASVTELRQWADRMLGQKAESGTGKGEPSTTSDLRGAREELEPVAGALQEDHEFVIPEIRGADASDMSKPDVSDPLEEVALAEEDALSVEEADVLEAAAAVDVPMEHADEDTPAEEVSPSMPQAKEEEQQEEEAPLYAWARFVEEKFGQKMDVPMTRAPRVAEAAAAGEAEGGSTPAWRRFMMGNSESAKADQAAKKRGKAKNVKLPDFFNMEDPRRELERLLPEAARRHDLAQSGFVQPLRDDADRASASAAAPVAFKASAPIDASAAAVFEPAQPPPRRVTVVEPPMDRLANAVTGYANLGRPRSERMGPHRGDMSMAETRGRGNYYDSPRLHPTRIFYPSQTYEPEDLVDTGEAIGWRKHAVKISGKRATNGDVRERADFRDQEFLNRFISELGKLPPKRTTRLQQKTHRHLCRQIKLARQMALLPIDTQLTAEYLERSGAVQRAGQSGIEHNPHMRPPTLDRRMRF